MRDDGLLGFTAKEGDGAAWSDATLGRPRLVTYWREQEVLARVLETGWEVLSLAKVDGRLEPWFVIARASATAS